MSLFDFRSKREHKEIDEIIEFMLHAVKSDIDKIALNDYNLSLLGNMDLSQKHYFFEKIKISLEKLEQELKEKFDMFRGSKGYRETIRICYGKLDSQTYKDKYFEEAMIKAKKEVNSYETNKFFKVLEPVLTQLEENVQEFEVFKSLQNQAMKAIEKLKEMETKYADFSNIAQFVVRDLFEICETIENCIVMQKNYSELAGILRKKMEFEEDFLSGFSKWNDAKRNICIMLSSEALSKSVNNILNLLNDMKDTFINHLLAYPKIYSDTELKTKIELKEYRLDKDFETRYFGMINSMYSEFDLLYVQLFRSVINQKQAIKRIDEKSRQIFTGIYTSFSNNKEKNYKELDNISKKEISRLKRELLIKEVPIQIARFYDEGSIAGHQKMLNYILLLEKIPFYTDNDINAFLNVKEFEANISLRLVHDVSPYPFDKDGSWRKAILDGHLNTWVTPKEYALRLYAIWKDGLRPSTREDSIFEDDILQNLQDIYFFMIPENKISQLSTFPELFHYGDAAFIFDFHHRYAVFKSNRTTNNTDEFLILTKNNIPVNQGLLVIRKLSSFSTQLKEYMTETEKELKNLGVPFLEIN